MSEQRHFPVGIETFEKIRKGNFVYVDKTDYIHQLVSNSGFYFLSRPRRFGKSLLLSTIKAFFEGRRDLFEGLAISRHDHSWLPHPVFHLNFVNFDSSSTDGLKSTIEQHLAGWEETYGKDIPGLDYAQRFYGIIKRACEATGRKAVVLIDEYDKALISSMEEQKLHNSFRAILKPIYGTLKAADQYIRFAMITGVSRFSRLSIFSDINNLRDITLNRKFCAICGFTETEMLRDFQPGIAQLARSLGTSFEEAVEALKKNYDGYHFSNECPDIYNPFSLMSALEDGELNSYWFATGTPTFLIESLRNSDIYLPTLLTTEADTTELSNIDSYIASPIALLFQTGYLTIKSYDPDFKIYRLGLPNREVANGFFKDLLPVYMNEGRSKGLQTVRDMCRDVNAGQPERLLTRLQAFLADIPYDLSKNKPEVYFENNIYIIFKLMGFTVETEYRTAAGRIDLLVKTKNFIYVIELKLNGTAGEAIAQIDDRQYALPFASDPRTLFKIGISFSKKTRNIDHWIIQNAE